MQITMQRVTCQKCGQVGEVEMVTDAPIPVALASMKAARCPHCGSDKIGLGGGYTDSPPLTAPLAIRADWWKERGEVGISSETIWSAFMGTRPEHVDIPYDPDDFRRCRLLLSVVPEWRKEIAKVADVYPWFQPFTDRWEAMDALFSEESPSGTCPKLYALMKAAEKEADKIKRGPKRYW